MAVKMGRDERFARDEWVWIGGRCLRYPLSFSFICFASMIYVLAGARLMLMVGHEEGVYPYTYMIGMS
jgi:hypothetical protein